MILDGAARPRERKFRLLRSGEHLGLDVEPLLDSVHKLGAIFGIPRRGRRNEADPLHAVARTNFRVLFGDLESAIEGFGFEAPSFIYALAQPHDLHAPLHLDGFARTGLDIGDQESNRVSSAINSRYAHRHTSIDQWGLSNSTARSPSGLIPGPTARACATKTCRHLTRVGIPPAEMPAISATSPKTARSAR